MKFGKRGVVGLMVVLFFLILSHFLQAQTGTGCFTQPSFVTLGNNGACGENVPRSTAETWCSFGSDCMAKYYFDGQSCSAVQICNTTRLGWCLDSCKNQANPIIQAACQDRNSFVAQTTKPDSCKTGCCVCVSGSQKICTGDLAQADCEQRCANLNYGFGELNFSVDKSTCESTTTPSFCGTYIYTASNLTGYVLNSTGGKIAGATVKVYDKSAQTDVNGKYTIASTAVGLLIVEATAANYGKSISSTVIGRGVSLEYNITLPVLSEGKFYGKVSDSNGVLSGVLVSASGPTFSQALTNGTGDYVLGNLPLGTYNLKAEKSGYQTGLTTNTLNQQQKQADFTLTRRLEGTVTGRVTDSRTTSPISNALIYVDNVFKTRTGDLGYYLVTVDIGKTYQIKAVKTDYATEEKTTVNFTTAGQNETINFQLNSTSPECGWPTAKNVSVFNASLVLGEKAVRLTWQRPCLEVTGYYINRTEGTTQSFVDYIDIVDPGQSLVYTDQQVDWGHTYQYRIWAAYADGFRLQQPAPTLSNSITLGSAECEGKYETNLGWLEFCKDSSRIRAVCSNLNQVTNIQNCSQQGEKWYCFGPDVTGDTACKESVCAVDLMTPFDKNTCLGNTRFCYWDKISGQEGCNECRGVNSCFQYLTEDACRTTNCFNKNCSWVNRTPELGYCFEVGYNGTNHCGDCQDISSSSCTPSVCTNLGACYSSQASSQCYACSATSRCDRFYSELECENGQETDVLSNGNIAPSKDACNLGTCDWVPTTTSSGYCIKDANDDEVSDCSTTSCWTDNKAPETELLPKSFIAVNKNTGLVTFNASKANMKKLTYCVSKQDTCLPNATINYTNTNQVQLNLATTDVLRNAYQGKGKYYIQFFSEDTYGNRERTVKSESVYVDLDDPSIQVYQNLTLNPAGSTLVFDIVILPAEKVNCTDRLTREGGGYSSSQIQGQINDSWRVSYTSLGDGLYKYNITCVDEVGNRASPQMGLISIDAVRNVVVEVPQPAIKVTSFKFKVRTNDSSNCVLYNGTENKGNLQRLDTGGYLHESQNTYSFVANQLYTSWRVDCTKTNPPYDTDSASIVFAVDFMAPETEIVLNSGDNIQRRFTEDNWYAFFNDDVSVSFNCLKKPNGGGFDCQPTRWCMTDMNSCTPNQTTTLPVLSGNFVMKTICYYSEDAGNNVETAKCGTVVISPFFGIQIIEPSYGVSSRVPFNLRIDSGVASNLCKWSVGDVPFNSIVSASNIFTAETNLRHVISGFSQGKSFPLNITIKCNSTDGRISPPESFEIDYDPTPPRILSARPSQSLVEYGNSVDLIVDTDDKTRCKYDKENKSFDTMTYKFGNNDEFDSGIFKTTNTKTISLSANDDNKTHTYYVICQNRAENVSSPATATFRVDFSTQGTITGTRPTGSIGDLTVGIGLTTNKAAYCEYRQNNTYYYFSQTGGTDHSQILGNLSEGQKTYPARCTIAVGPTAGSIITGTISFIVDRTPPTMTEVDDGNNSCSLTKINVRFKANDTVSAISEYSFEVFKTGNLAPLASGNTGSSSVEIKDLNLTEGSTYYVKAKAKDAAGNWGDFEESDGFVARLANYSACREKGKPTLSFGTQASATGVSVTVNCNDDTGCVQVKYGTALTQAECSATLTYSSSFVLTSTKYVCAEGYDASNNKGERTERVFVNDADGDGVGDTYDLCANTTHGAVVDSNGCSDQQKNIDTDTDRLPDWWELRYDDAGCEFDMHEADSDVNGVDDDEEDYDEDGLTNYEEYLAGGHPCLLEDSDYDGVPNNIDECPSTLAGEQVDAKGCALSQTVTCDDGIDDAWKIRYFNSILCTGDGAASADPDDDGLSNFQEYTYKTSPTNEDTDGDGYSDGEEITNSWNPLDPGSPAAGEGASVLAIILLIIGNLLVWGGIIFLLFQVYLQRMKRPSYRPGPAVMPRPGMPPARPAAPIMPARPYMPPRTAPPISEARERLRERIAKKREERAREMEKKREEVFGTFGAKKEGLPMMEKIVKKEEKPVVERLTDLTHHYLNKKEEIAPKLEEHEKKVFEDLARFAKKPTKTEIKKVLKEKPTEELHGVFNKLVDIIGKRSDKKDVFEKLKKYAKKQ